MTKEELIEKLNKIYEMGKDHCYLKMYDEVELKDDAQKLIEEVAENILLKFKIN